MSKLRVRTVIDAPPATVWAQVRDIASHVGWMADAVAIHFLSEQREGVGTTFDCDTKIGPFSLTDRMHITEWAEGSAMGVKHVGVVTGEGVFRLKPKGRRGKRTLFTWEERLRFPWWMGGPIGALAGSLVMRPLWNGNLRRLKRQVEKG